MIFSFVFNGALVSFSLGWQGYSRDGQLNYETVRQSGHSDYFLSINTVSGICRTNNFPICRHFNEDT